MTPTIIVFGLEDDAEDTELMTRAFKGLGITDVEFFSDPEEFFHCFTPDIHVAVVDYNLPGMNGQEVMDKIFRINKSCKVTIMSGALTNEMMANLVFSGAKGCVEKKDGWETKLAELVKGHIEATHLDLAEFNKVSNEIKGLFKR